MVQRLQTPFNLINEKLIDTDKSMKFILRVWFFATYRFSLNESSWLDTLSVSYINQTSCFQFLSKKKSKKFWLFWWRTKSVVFTIPTVILLRNKMEAFKCWQLMVPNNILVISSSTTRKWNLERKTMVCKCKFTGCLEYIYLRI